VEGEKRDAIMISGNTVTGQRAPFTDPCSWGSRRAACLFTGIYGLSMVAFLGTPCLLLLVPGSLYPWPTHALALIALLGVGAAGLWLRALGIHMMALAQHTGTMRPWTPRTARVITILGWGVAFTPYVLMSALSGYPIPPFSAAASNLLAFLVVLLPGLLSFVLCGKMAHARTLDKQRLLVERFTALEEHTPPT